MNVTFSPNNIKTAEEIKAYGISKSVIADCERAAEVLRSIDNTRRDSCEIRGMVTTEDYSKKNFFSNYSVKGSLSFDTETGKTKCMDARTEESHFAYNTGSFVKQEIRDDFNFFQSGGYIVYQSQDGRTLTVQNDPGVIRMTL